MDTTSVWLILGVACVFLSAIFVYLLFLVFLPEWVGVTGKVALEAERSHREGSVGSGDEGLDRMHKTKT